MDHLSFLGFHRLVNLIRTGTPLDCIMNNHGRAIHADAESFLARDRHTKRTYVRALYSAWSNGVISVFIDIASQGLLAEKAQLDGLIRACEAKKRIDGVYEGTLSREQRP